MRITADTSSLYKIKPYLPQKISSCFARLDKNTIDKICEIRMRRDGITTVTVDGKNLILSLSGITSNIASAIKTTKEEIDDFVYRFCKGSVYSHENTLSEFYIVSDGIRVGISGQASYMNDMGMTVGEIHSLNIRLPRHVSGCSKVLVEHINQFGFSDGSGILIASSPGVGKTTVLRDLAVNLSDGTVSPMRRVCIIDERNEIYMNRVFENCCTDFLSGVNKIKGLEIAARVLSPQIIICDEISGPDEAEKILRQKNGGIIFIASVHSDSYHDAMNKDYIKELFDKGVFSHICILSRTGTKINSEIIKYKNDY